MVSTTTAAAVRCNGVRRVPEYGATLRIGPIIAGIRRIGNERTWPDSAGTDVGGGGAAGAGLHVAAGRRSARVRWTAWGTPLERAG